MILCEPDPRYIRNAADSYDATLSHLANVTPEITAVPGRLQNNVLHVALPPFTLQTAVTAHGEIDGGP
jgi:hypothetical protein